MKEEIYETIETYELVDKDGKVVASGLTYDEYKTIMKKEIF